MKTAKQMREIYGTTRLTDDDQVNVEDCLRHILEVLETAATNGVRRIHIPDLAWGARYTTNAKKKIIMKLCDLGYATDEFTPRGSSNKSLMVGFTV